MQEKALVTHLELHNFGEYKVEEIDRKLSRKTDFDLLREFESVCDQLLGSRKGKK